MSTNLNNKQLNAISLFLAGSSSKEVAEQVKVRKETVSRWRANPNFRDELRCKRVEYFDKLIQSQFSLVQICQKKIEEALLGKDLSECQKAQLAIKFIGQFHGKLSTVRELKYRKDEAFLCLDD